MTVRGMTTLSHVAPDGSAAMVDVGDKAITRRLAVACGRVCVSPAALEAVLENRLKKGDVLRVAQIAGILGAKQTSQLIPLCHPLPLDKVDVFLTPENDPAAPGAIWIFALACTTGRTGVEMEALTAVSVAGLTVVDMLKAVDPAAVIGDIQLLFKAGGARGHIQVPQPQAWARFPPQWQPLLLERAPPGQT